MNRPRPTPCAAACLALFALGACSLLPKPAPTIRWFSATPASEPSDWAQPDDPEATRTVATLRLRRVTAARHLGERIAWRRDVEFGYRDLERWTELPDVVVAGALERRLFETGAFARDGRATLALDVDVRGFEEARDVGAARIELYVLLSGPGDRALIDRTVVAEVSLDGDGPEDLAAAMRRALVSAVESISDLIARVPAP